MEYKKEDWVAGRIGCPYLLPDAQFFLPENNHTYWMEVEAFEPVEQS